MTIKIVLIKTFVAKTIDEILQSILNVKALKTFCFIVKSVRLRERARGSEQ